MIGASKILTVSYGTFSCTLEGFDEPFNTMKAIAEYFRDLAAGDRYFGAEPPTPDAAMLHAIAEREIKRRVESKIQDNGVILRAAELAEPGEGVMPALAIEQADRVPAPASKADKKAAKSKDKDKAKAAKATLVPIVIDSEIQSEEPAPSLTQGSSLSSVAQTLSRMRSLRDTAPQVLDAETEEDGEVVLSSDPASPTPKFWAEDLEDLADFEPPVAAKVDLPDMAEDLLPAPFDAGAFDQSDEISAQIDEALADVADEAEVIAQSPISAPTEAVLASAAEDGDMFARILDKVEPVAEPLIADLEDEDLDVSLFAEAKASEGPADFALSDDDLTNVFAPEADALDAPDDTRAFIADVLQGNAPELAAEDSPAVEDIPDDSNEADPAFWADDAQMPQETLVDDDDGYLDDVPEAVSAPKIALPAASEAIEALETQVARDETAVDAETVEDPAAALPTTALDSVDDQAAAPSRRQRKVRRLGAVQPAPDQAAEPVAASPAPAPAPAAAEVPVAASAPAPSAAVETEASGQTEAPALQKARARVIRIRKADITAPTPEAAATAPRPVGRTATLSEQAEAELAAELAALEGGAFDAPATEQPDIADPIAAPAANMSTILAADSAVDRLIAKTDSELEKPEARRRLSAIQHLKAAVVATSADRQDKRSADDYGNEGQDRYRRDLDQVVRASRAAPPVAPATPAPALASAPAPAAAPAPRPAPLVLVSEQRIDLPRSPAPAVSPVSVVASQGIVQPIRPRRIVVTRPAAGAAAAQAPAAAAQEAPAAPQVMAEPELEDGLIDQEIAEMDDLDMGSDSLDNIFTSDASRSFADFAEDLGVLDLSELLEAAAVYNTIVLNRPEFTRAHLFRQVEDVTKDEAPALEDVLAEFGDLLREGRMQKMRRGTYAVGPTSPLMVEARKIAG